MSHSGIQHRDGARRPRLIALVQLPPPTHGASVMNQRVVTSERVRDLFDLDLIPLKFARGVGDIGRPRLGKLLTFIRIWFRLLGRCILRSPDLAYVSLSPTGWASIRDLAFVFLLKAFRVHTVMHIHGRGLRSFLRQTRLEWLYISAFRGETLILLAPALADEYSRLVTPDQVRYLPNGIPDDLYSPSREVGASAICRLLFLSNIMREKGPLDLIRAIAELSQDGLPIQCTFVGEFVTSAFREELVGAIRSAGLEGTIVCTGGTYGAERATHFNNADIFVFPSYYGPEAFPLAVLEAMSAGLPVVASDAGAIPAIVQEGITGYVVPARDHELLAARIRCLVLNPAERERLGKNGRARYLRYFTLAHFEERIAELLRAEMAELSECDLDTSRLPSRTGEPTEASAGK